MYIFCNKNLLNLLMDHHHFDYIHKFVKKTTTSKQANSQFLSLGMYWMNHMQEVLAR